MSIGATREDGAKATSDIAVEIVVPGQLDALELSEFLIPFHSALVQLSPNRWVLHARSPGRQGELADAHAVIGNWRGTRSVG